MHADLESIVCKFGRDPAIFVCKKKRFAQKFTDGRTDDGRRAIALAEAHSWNELKTLYKPITDGIIIIYNARSSSTIVVARNLSCRALLLGRGAFLNLAQFC